MNEIKTRFVAKFQGVTLGWYDTWEEAEDAIETARQDAELEEVQA